MKLDSTVKKLRFLGYTDGVKGYKTLDEETGYVSYIKVAKFDESIVTGSN